MKKLGLVFGLTLVLGGCGAKDAIDGTKQMPGKMDRMLGEMNRTNGKVEQQCAVLTFDGMLKEEYGRELIPIPFDLMAFAREFGKCASDEQVVELVYIWVKRLNEVTMELPAPTEEQTNQFNHRKLHIYSALQAMSGLLEQPKLERIIDREIYGAGRYQDSALTMLMLRAQFLRDVLLEASLFSEGLTNVGKVEKAVEYAEQIEYLARLAFSPEIGVTVTGFIAPMDDVKESFDPAVALKTWRKIKVKAERLSLEMKSWTGKPNEDARLYAMRQQRMNKALSIINGKINGWSGRP